MKRKTKEEEHREREREELEEKARRMREYDAHKAESWKEAQETLRDVARQARDDDSEETAELVQETARNFSKMVNEYNGEAVDADREAVQNAGENLQEISQNLLEGRDDVYSGQIRVITEELEADSEAERQRENDESLEAFTAMAIAAELDNDPHAYQSNRQSGKKAALGVALAEKADEFVNGDIGHFYDTHREEIEREIDDLSRASGRDIRRGVSEDDYKERMSTLALNSVAGRLEQKIDGQDFETTQAEEFTGPPIRHDHRPERNRQRTAQLEPEFS